MGNIFVIGPRKSGKTTYLAGLAYWSQRKAFLKQNRFAVHPVNEDARYLAEQAKNIILPQESLEATRIPLGGFTYLPIYSFNIEVYRKLNYKDKKLNFKEVMNLVVKDIAGEIFDSLEEGVGLSGHKDFFQECFMQDVTGCLIILTSWQEDSDESYVQKLSEFVQLMDTYERIHNLRVAVAIGKCERGELWPGRLDPEIDLFDVHLPRTKSLLRSKISPKNLRFFALSTFGVLGRNDPRPNRIDEPGWNSAMSVLREPDKWKPYGMFSPLYWLSTGKRMGLHV